MNRLSDNERLLNDVLTDESPAGFRDGLLNTTLRLARHRRRWRRTRRVGGVLALVALVAVVVWQNPLQRASPLALRHKVCQVVESQPLTAGMVVATLPVSTERLITSSPAADIVHTTVGGGSYREVGDNELLDLAAPRITALVRHGPHEAELVFVESGGGVPSRDN